MQSPKEHPSGASWSNGMLLPCPLDVLRTFSRKSWNFRLKTLRLGRLSTAPCDSAKVQRTNGHNHCKYLNWAIDDLLFQQHPTTATAQVIPPSFSVLYLTDLTDLTALRPAHPRQPTHQAHAQAWWDPIYRTATARSAGRAWEARFGRVASEAPPTQSKEHLADPVGTSRIGFARKVGKEGKRLE